jgi:hypothetical protein
MTKKASRPPLGGLTSPDDDLDRIRQYGLRKGFLPTDPVEAGIVPPAPPPAPVQAAPSAPPAAAAPIPVQAPVPVPPTPTVIRPAPTKPWQAMFPDYLIDELRHAAAREGTAQKVVVMRALRQAGYRVDEIDLQDLRRR